MKRVITKNPISKRIPKRLTKRRALSLCFHMWNWISQQEKCINKYDYCHEFGLPIIRNNCWCCEYDRKSTYYTCQECPLLEHFKGNSEVTVYVCEDGKNDNYNPWFYNSETYGINDKKAADNLAQACLERIKEIGL